MKKVLILAYDFPPYVSVGALRPYSWYKYLQEFGVYPIVITRQWNNIHGNYLDYIMEGHSIETIIEKSPIGTILRAPYKPNLANRLMYKYGDSKYKTLRKLITGFFELGQYFFFIGPKSSLYFSADQYLKENKVDAIIATGEPFILFKYASELSKKHNTPWIADYRDAWTHNFTRVQNYFLPNWDQLFEKRYLDSASHITTVSFFLQNTISSLVKHKNIFILPNGFDPEAINNAKDIPQQSETFSISFIGTYYKWYPIKSVLSVFSLFIKNKKDIKLKLNFYGIDIPTELKEMLTDHFPELIDHVSIIPNQPNAELLKCLAKDNVMLLFNNYYYMGTKIYDYIGIKRIILFCYSNDDAANQLKDQYYKPGETYGTNGHLQEDLINLTNSGHVIQNDKHLLSTLGNLYEEFITNGYVNCNTINEDNYSRKYQVEQLAEIIKNIDSLKKEKNSK